MTIACISKRRGKYVVDYYDARRERRWISCDTRREAEDKLAEKLREVKLLSGAVCAFCMIRMTSTKNNDNITAAPTNPCSSAKAEKIKSL